MNDESFKTILDLSDLREIDLHESSKGTTLIEQTLVVRGTFCLY